MKTVFILLFTLFTFNLTFGQSTYTSLRYRHAIYTNISTIQNVQYGSAPKWTWPYPNEDLYLDIYTPLNDNITNRPLIIFAHAGGFLNGAKEVDDMVAICDSFAKKGYVTASIAYRKGFNPLDAESAERAVYRGIQDGKAAVRFFKNNANLYGIDTNYIYFGGMSAGGFIANHIAYMNLESERPQSTYGGGTVNNLGCLDCSGNNYPHTSKVRAAINYWGAIQDTTLIEQNDTPMLLMHGTTDPIVPYEYGKPFGLFTLPNVYGSKPIQERLENLAIYNEIYISNRQGQHMLDGSDNGTFNGQPFSFWYDTLLPRTTDFLVKMSKPSIEKTMNDSLVFCYQSLMNFSVNGDDNHYYIWELINSENDTITFNNHSRTIQHQIQNPGEYKLAIISFNEIYCASDTIWHYIKVSEPVTASFDFTISNYTDVLFENQSINAISYHWNFGDGTTSSEPNPTHTYTSNGVYDVILTIANQDGCESTITKQVNIHHLSLSHLPTIEYYMYPNPVENFLSIETNMDQPVNFILSDLNGKTLIQQLVQSKAIIDVSFLSKGVYLTSVGELKNKIIKK